MTSFPAKIPKRARFAPAKLYQRVATNLSYYNACRMQRRIMGAAIITAIKLILRVSDRCGRTGFLSTRKIVLVSPLRPIPRILLISKDLFFYRPRYVCRRHTYAAILSIIFHSTKN